MKGVRDLFFISSLVFATGIAGYKSVFKETYKDINNDGLKDSYTQNILDNKYTIKFERSNGRYIVLRDVDSTNIELFKNINIDSVSVDSLEKIVKYRK